MATTIYDYLLRRKADLETRMLEAQRRAQAPFEDELRALSLALSAIERGGLAAGGHGGLEGEPASFAHAATSRRGRKPRSARDMILMVLGKDDAAIAASEISRKLTRRWGRAIPLAAVMLELQGLEQEGQVRRSDEGWVRIEEPPEVGGDLAPAPLAISA
ncbi:winged-helix domain-containing protein [Caulobacter soli]|uniref:winged-helix domain-containing protein n=1 Tax=Caulobacter soli TaxID=2708539 RepID=UPI0013E9E469|nr:winged-helix domain-containing protein [Caulobacter soli]